MKRIISATLVLLFAFSSNVSAHTGLTSSSPANGEDITEDVFEIVLEFNTKIESTSIVKVFDENNKERRGIRTQKRYDLHRISQTAIKGLAPNDSDWARTSDLYPVNFVSLK